MTKYLARAISDIFNPVVLLLPVPYLLVLHRTQDADYSFRWAFFSWLFLILIGLIMIYLVRKGIFSDLDVSKREQRPLLFLLSGFLTFAYCVSIFILNGPRVLMVTALGILIGIFILSIINTYIKASIHLATVSALLSALGLVYGGAYIALFLLIPVIGWARVKTHRHTITETIVGSVLGALLTLFMYVLVKYILQFG